MYASFDDIINAASQSSLMPLFEKDAAMGMVPYMQSGEAIPSALAAAIPRIPMCLSPMARKVSWILSFKNTETADPRSIPRTQ